MKKKLFELVVVCVNLAVWPLIQLLWICKVFFCGEPGPKNCRLYNSLSKRVGPIYEAWVHIRISSQLNPHLSAPHYTYILHLFSSTSSHISCPFVILLIRKPRKIAEKDCDLIPCRQTSALKATETEQKETATWSGPVKLHLQTTKVFFVVKLFQQTAVCTTFGANV